jgi:hypothetical protein
MFTRRHNIPILPPLGGSPYVLKPLVLAAALSIVAGSVAEAGDRPTGSGGGDVRSRAGASLGGDHRPAGRDGGSRRGDAAGGGGPRR